MTTTKTDPRDAITAASLANGGGTFTRTAEPVTTGVAVTTRVLGYSPRIYDAILEFAWSMLPEGALLGTWYDPENDRWEISETVTFANREDALTLARSLGERYVYDIDTDECIAVPSMSTQS